ncbi:hypothetical protein TYRP_006859 [Tyrophagus putrescentiae]|nr:hypothetical protein TYRP_006859 [Tyrophagus putrescentiae]
MTLPNNELESVVFIPLGEHVMVRYLPPPYTPFRASLYSDFGQQQQKLMLMMTNARLTNSVASLSDT